MLQKLNTYVPECLRLFLVFREMSGEVLGESGSSYFFQNDLDVSEHVEVNDALFNSDSEDQEEIQGPITAFSTPNEKNITKTTYKCAINN